MPVHELCTFSFGIAPGRTVGIWRPGDGDPFEWAAKRGNTIGVRTDAHKPKTEWPRATHSLRLPHKRLSIDFDEIVSGFEVGP
jgi:hypothetical protein